MYPMKLHEVLPIMINSSIYFYIEINKRLYSNEIILNRYELLYADLYKRLYTEFTNRFNTDEVYSISVLNDINPHYVTYNKLSSDNNILETLDAYIEDYLIRYRIPMHSDNVIMCMDIDVPFELGVNITYRWLKQIIDIYR